jgi:hypothetical protein
MSETSVTLRGEKKTGTWCLDTKVHGVWSKSGLTSVFIVKRNVKCVGAEIPRNEGGGGRGRRRRRRREENRVMMVIIIRSLPPNITAVIV